MGKDSDCQILVRCHLLVSAGGLWGGSYGSWRKSIFQKERQDRIESPTDMNLVTLNTHTHTHTYIHTHSHHSGCCVENGVAEGENEGRELSYEVFQ